MKYLKSILFMVFIALFTIPNYSQDVRGLKWGMDQTTVHRIESSKGIKFHNFKDSESFLTADGTVDGKLCLLVYSFDYFKKALIGVGMAFNTPLFGKRQDRVDEFIEILSNKYGNYTLKGNDYIWENSRTKVTLTPKEPKGNISISYESLVKFNNSRDF